VKTHAISSKFNAMADSSSICENVLVCFSFPIGVIHGFFSLIPRNHQGID